MRRFVPQFFLARVPGQLPQVLAIGLRIFRQQFGQRRIAFGDQLVAHCLDPVQGGVFAARIGFVVVHPGADRFQGFRVFPPELLGQETDRALAGNLRGHALRRHGQRDQVFAQWQLHQPRGGLFHQPVGKIEHRERLAAQIAAAGAEIFA